MRRSNVTCTKQSPDRKGGSVSPAASCGPQAHGPTPLRSGLCLRTTNPRSGQALTEFALLYTAVIVPLIFMCIFVSQMLWVWHSVVDFTRDGARYASTHCWMADGGNVLQYMQGHVPLMIDRNQFQSTGALIQLQYFQRDPVTGALSPFSCTSSECSAGCIPDAVSVAVTNYQFFRFSTFMKLPPVTIPPFTTNLPMESAGCDEAGNCLP